jgi:hypothetical protein
MIEQTIVDLTPDISNDNIDQISKSAMIAAINGVLRFEPPPDKGPKDLCITPMLASNPITVQS